MTAQLLCSEGLGDKTVPPLRNSSLESGPAPGGGSLREAAAGGRRWPWTGAGHWSWGPQDWRPFSPQDGVTETRESLQGPSSGAAVCVGGRAAGTWGLRQDAALADVARREAGAWERSCAEEASTPHRGTHWKSSVDAPGLRPGQVTCSRGREQCLALCEAGDRCVRPGTAHSAGSVVLATPGLSQVQGRGHWSGLGTDQRAAGPEHGTNVAPSRHRVPTRDHKCDRPG